MSGWKAEENVSSNPIELTKENTLKIIPVLSAVALMLVGCAGNVHGLIQEDRDRDITVGTFQHEGPDGPSMMLEFDGIRFEARGFAINSKQNLAELRRRYGPGRHYDRIFSGADTDHFEYLAEPVLRAENGASLRCVMTWMDKIPASGHCVTADGLHINFRFN